ncbi:MAG: hypothetical protein IMZ69_08865 [Spirochaetes bacterium]|nr:hypothetical protein [Spirochaetota bacterium]
MPTVHAERDITILREPIQLDLSLNDLRMMVNCMRAVEYQMSIDDETYLDDDARALKKRLEGTYERTIVELSNHRDSSCS